ncbi:hypothetical protein CALVIDRAFT_532597 [Calocera viscosa TUFC12733]|uniref:TRIP4/RQT4 C2HC5-type zinc finger domain-containing protein n=1 Tax=Calocera viscosa (strain TUFC12733) TaxID=1330018 RepID=A0A167SEQ3_CALVF|nr:hypothetical protein CALVIDRAFT_532597 [Calocera viscosa TUFC12733]
MANTPPFGIQGTVYRKDRTDESDWLLPTKKKGGSGSSSHEPSRSTTPQPGSSTRAPAPTTHRAPAGSFTSDLLSKPRTSHPPQGKQSKPGSGASTPKPPPVSPAVKHLLTRIESLQALSTYPPTATPNPCFCLARTHALSPYVPICTHCGLILCELQPPACTCPSCGEALLTHSQRQGLLNRLDEEMSAVLDSEEREKQRKEEEERQRLMVQSGGGAFPTLGGRPAPVVQPPPQERKVLTIGKGRRGPTLVTMKTVTKPPPDSKQLEEPAEPEVPRISRPGKQPLPPASKLKELETRPWANLWMREGDRPVYVPPPKPVEQRKEGEAEHKKSRRRRRGGKEGKENAEEQPKAEAVASTSGPS